MAKPFILFITGISTSGKTTVYEALAAKKLANLDIRDIDENGVPPVGRNHWRAYRVAQLLYEGIQNYKKGKSTIICGITMPHEVIEASSYKPGLNIHFLYLKVPFETFKKRINSRVAANQKSKEFDEVFDPNNYEALLMDSKRLARVLENSTANQKRGHTIDTGKLDKTALVGAVEKLIAQITS